MIDIRSINHNVLRDKVYNNACKHGWHDTNRLASHWTMMVITEMSEAIQADRKDLHADVKAYERSLSAIPNKPQFTKLTYKSFEKFIKNTYEDELADIVIRCYDMLGLKKFDVDTFFATHQVFKDLDIVVDYYLKMDIPNFMYILTSTMVMGGGFNERDNSASVCIAIWLVYQYANNHNIDLPWFVAEKMRYNGNRPYMHECKY